jgi:hypothetical protein
MDGEPSAGGELQGAPDALLGDTPDFFEIALEELAHRQSFHSHLFAAPAAALVKPLALPECHVVSDLVCHAAALSNLGSRAEVLRELLSPIFLGTAENMSKELQILTSCFDFLRKRPLAAFSAESERRAARAGPPR